MRAAPIYVEIVIAASMDAVWTATQDPDRHREWDLRFSRIEYAPRASADVPQQFVYATRIGFGLDIAGRGESVGTLEKNGERTSALRFWSDDPKSLIRAGAGYWKYMPLDQGVRFLTRYDYETRFGAAGRVLDALAFRPLLGWATAWSFDCLRIALERGIPPAHSIAIGAARAVCRVAAACTWIYQGLVPKLLFPDTGEREILRASGFFRGYEENVLVLAGVGEVVLGALLLMLPRSAKIVVWMLVFLAALLAVGATSQSSILVAPFNPVSLTIALAGLGAAELVLARSNSPSAARCRRAPLP